MDKKENFKTVEIDGEEVGLITYSSYIGLESEPSKSFIMISELIDNSISSFENELENNWTKDNQLIINIDFNFKGKELPTKIADEFNYIENSYISVSDNGYGMKDYKNADKTIDKCLSDAVKYGNKNTQKSDKNKWGKGMKHCAYYFGQDIKITTSNGTETAQIIRNFTDPEIQLNTPYPYNSEIIETLEKGTDIIISNIYWTKAFGQSAFNNIVDSLSWRYINYLKSEKLVVNLTFEDNKTLKKLDETLKPQEEKIRKLSEDKKSKITFSARERIIKTGWDNFKDKCDGEYKKRVNTYTKNNEKLEEQDREIDLTIFKSAYLMMAELIKKSVKDENADDALCETINLDIKNPKTKKNIKVPFKFWILPLSTEAKNAGIRLYEGERAVKHVSTKDPEVNPWTGYQKGSDDANRTNKKFAGSIDLKPAGIETVKDKSNFKFPDDVLVKLSRDIWSVFKAVEIFIINIAKEDKTEEIEKEKVKINQAKIESAINQLNQSIQTEIIFDKENSEGNKVSLIRKMDEDKWITNIEIDDSTSNSKHMLIPHIEAEKNITIVVYVKHKVWQSIRQRNKNIDEFIEDVISTRTHSLITHSINITKKLNLLESERTNGVYEILKEIGDEYLDKDL